MQNQEKLIKSKRRQDGTSKTISLVLSWFFSLMFIALIGFIIYASIPGFQEYGIENILFTGEYNLNDNKASIWLPLCITILTAGLAILIGAPIGIKTAVFIKFRLPQRYQKSVRVAVELLADIPSVIFGLFAVQSLGMVVQAIFGLSSVYSLVTSSFMLAFMILPTIISLSLNSLDSVDPALIPAAMVLGNTKTRAIYKVYKKEARAGITVAVIIAISRAIGETMAVSMILQSQSYNMVFSGGFFAIMDSYLKTLGALIATNMFAEGGGPALQGLLFAFGLFLFIFVMILNAIAMKMTKKKARTKHTWWNKFEKWLAAFVLFIPTQISILYNKLVNRKEIKLNDDLSNLSQYYSKRSKENKWASNSYSVYKQIWEWVCFTLTMAFLIWIVGDIIIQGLVGVFAPSSSIFSLAKGSTGQAIINTLLIIIIAIGIGLPLALMIAIYINEFAKEGKMKKVMLFFIDSLGATPSILFGMFGMIFFIQTLGLSSAGVAGKSLIAGALTILIVILPTFIRTIQQALNTVPKELRTCSYALGAGKWETIRKVVLPASFQAITTAVVLAIGRILAETAPLFLTAGLDSSNTIALDSPGQTLTTRIFAQIYNNDYTSAVNIMYECAFVTMILVLLIIVIVHVFIPWYYKRKRDKLKEKSKPPVQVQTVETSELIKPLVLDGSSCDNEFVLNKNPNWNYGYKNNVKYYYRLLTQGA